MQWKLQAHLLLILFMTSTIAVTAQDHDAGMINGRMWTFDQPPLEYFGSEYGFVPDETWLEEARLAALRFGGGCSASFVSADGLVMTNFHCGIDAVGKVTHEGENLRLDGFYATTLEDERRVPDLHVDQLVAMHDVTDEIVNAMAPATEAEQAFAARDKAINEITQRYSTDGLHCEVVTFYSGARYSAYQYKRYEDVRLVFSAELSFAFFGGIYDFWSYPRYSFDCDFFRVYEHDKPLRTQHFYPWSRGGAAEEEAVFVVGNPGRTNRLTTVDMLAYERDKNVPNLVRLIDDRKEVLEAWLRTHPEEGNAWFDELFGIVNAQEAYSGRLVGLRDDELMDRRAAFDQSFRRALQGQTKEWEEYGNIWDRIREVTQGQYEIADDLFALRTGGLGVSALVTRATMLLDWLEQMSRADEDREERYRGERGTIMGRTLAGAISTPMEMERMTLTRQLQRMQDILGDDDAAVQLALAGETAEQAAERLLSQTILADSLAMQDIVKRQSLDGVDDVLIRLAGEMQPRFQAAAQRSGQLGTALRSLTNELGRAQYAVYGDDIPPDATFTLRISDGRVRGYSYNGTIAPVYTTFYGMYDRYHSFRDSEAAWDAMMGGNAFELPGRWLNPPVAFDRATPYNFVSTTDIVGGNSGSAIINRNREVVGLAHDGNFEGLSGSFIFAPEKGNRTIALHSEGILEALRHVYRATRIVEEIEAGRREQ